MHPIFKQYQENAPSWCRKLFLNALKLLLPKPLVRHDGPTTMLATLNNQKALHRCVLHLLHYIPECRSGTIDTTENVIPLHEVGLSVRTNGLPSALKSVIIVPEGMELPFTGCQSASYIYGENNEPPELIRAVLPCIGRGLAVLSDRRIP